ncbi:MAG: hypothetical protein M3Z04_14435 [Chloroflexota bacterium]|nr:hypothetical protein [Chloroflexota bacterium]
MEIVPHKKIHFNIQKNIDQYCCVFFGMVTSDYFLFGVGNIVSLGLPTSSQQYNFINIITFIPMFPLQIGFKVHQLYEDIGLGASTWIIIVGSILSVFSILLITASIELAIHKIVVKKKHSSKKL